MATIVLTDDHILLRNGLAGLVKSLGHTVLFEADNGKDMIEKLAQHELPDIVLMDINMPEMDGCMATEWLRINYPKVKVLALSMDNKEASIIQMLTCGAKGYILKDSQPQELKAAIESLMTEGFHYSELLNGKLILAINKMGVVSGNVNSRVQLHEKETDFLKLCCTELTYKEIAEQLSLSPRTVDGYRDALFEKLHVKTRIGLVIYAVKNEIVKF